MAEEWAQLTLGPLDGQLRRVPAGVDDMTFAMAPDDDGRCAMARYIRSGRRWVFVPEGMVD